MTTTAQNRPAAAAGARSSRETGGPEFAVKCETEGKARRRWLGLIVISMGQLLIAVDATIINVALPSVSQALQISEVNRPWVVTVYSLAFGGLLLLGGKIADQLGRRRAFVTGLVGFGLASALGGLAQNLPVLLLARGLQGAFAALLAPAALALLATAFLDARERAKAFAIFGAVAGGGSAIGLFLGGVLTEYASWRWTLFVNVPLAGATVAGAIWLLDADRGRQSGRIDLPGAALATGGLVTLVYSFSEAQRNGWGKPMTLTLVGVGAALLIGFVTTERLVSDPMLPPRILAHRVRAGSNVAVAVASVALYGVFFFLTFFMQVVLHYSPIRTGAAFLAMTGGLLVSSGAVSQLGTKIKPRTIMVSGMLGAVAGSLLLLRIGIHSTYSHDLMPPLVLIGVSLGCVFIPAFDGATTGVADQDAGIASASINTSAQVGGSLGVALLSAVSASRAAEWLSRHGADPANAMRAQVEGDRRAALWSAVILIGATVAAWILMDARSAGAPAAEAIQADADEDRPGPAGTGTDTRSAELNRVGHQRPDDQSLGTEPPTHLAGSVGLLHAGWTPEQAQTGNAAIALIRNADGHPVPRAVWTVICPQGKLLREGVAGPTGSVRCDLGARQEAVLVVQAPGYFPRALTIRSHPDTQPPAIDVELEESGAVLTGTVRVCDGSPAPMTSVWLTDTTGAVIASTRTAANGSYAMHHVPPGDHELCAAAAFAAVRNVEVFGSGDVEVDLRLAARPQGCRTR